MAGVRVSRTLTVVRKSRRRRRCERCRGAIRPGELYRDARLPPGNPDVGNTRWLRLAQHVEGGCHADS